MSRIKRLIRKKGGGNSRSSSDEGNLKNALNSIATFVLNRIGGTMVRDLPLNAVDRGVRISVK